MLGKKVKIVLEADGGELTREYAYGDETDTEVWGKRIESMLDTIEKSKEVKF